MIVMAFVAVDKDGTESVFDEKPYMSGIGNYWVPDSEHYVEIPKGSIKKLIGRELSWEDEPVELKEE